MSASISSSSSSTKTLKDTLVAELQEHFLLQVIKEDLQPSLTFHKDLPT